MSPQIPISIGMTTICATNMNAECLPKKQKPLFHAPSSGIKVYFAAVW